MTAPTVWDPLNSSGAGYISGAVAASSSQGSAVANRTLTAALSYFEVEIVGLNGGTCAVGLANRLFSGTSGSQLGSDLNGIGYASGGAVTINGSTLATLAAYGAGTTVGVAVDAANRLVWFTLDGSTWNDAASTAQDPVGGVGGISLAAMTDYGLLPAVWGSASTPAAPGTPSSSSDYNGSSTALAFDGNQSTFWASAGGVSPTWLQYEFPSAVSVPNFEFFCRNDGYASQGPATISVEGSNDGSTWTALGSITCQPWAAGVAQAVASSDPSASFSYYRANFTESPSAPGGNTALSEFTLLSAGGYPLPEPGTVLEAAFYSFSYSAPAGYAAAGLCGATAHNSDASSSGTYSNLGGVLSVPVASPGGARASTRDMGQGTTFFMPAGPITRASGTVLQAGAPVAKTVRLYDTETGALIGETVSSGTDGTYSIPALGRPRVDVVAKDPTSYQALIFDNVTPE